MNQHLWDIRYAPDRDFNTKFWTLEFRFPLNFDSAMNLPN